MQRAQLATHAESSSSVFFTKCIWETNSFCSSYSIYSHKYKYTILQKVLDIVPHSLHKD